jgi:putative ABC transport system substrate-binding protein
MRRRDFIKVTVGTAAAWPLAARAQQPRPVIGFLGTVAQEMWAKPVAAFEGQLREHGWIDGRTIKIIYRWGEGRPERFAEIATEFVNSNVDVIVTGGNAVSAVRQATSTIPIVFALAVDPVGSGFVNSLSRPSGSNCCARLPLVAADWQYWSTSVIQRPKKSWRRFKQRRGH